MWKTYNTPALTAVFGALSDPTRRSILEILTRGPRTVLEIAANFAISLPAVSKHLRVLENAGILRRKRNGRTHIIGLETKPLEQASEYIAQYQRFWEERLDSLEEFLEDNPQLKEGE